MSTRDDLAAELDAEPVELLRRWYHVPALLGVFAFMFWTRIRSYDNFVRDGEVYLTGNDAWYHYRETSYLLENYPDTMSFDPWTGFPFGTTAGAFGTLWDHMMAVLVVLASPITGGGDAGTLQAMLFMTPIFSVFTGVVVYFLARRFLDRFFAVSAVGILALLPGRFFRMGLVGFSDHHMGEVFFQTLAVLAFLSAFAVAIKEKPVWELVVDRDWTALKRPALYAVGAGVALGLYMWTWQPGVLMVGFTGIFVAIKMTSDVYHGDSPEPIAFAAAIAMAVAGAMQVIPLEDLSFGVSGYSLTQIVLPLGVAIGAVFLAWLARQWETRELGADRYPAAVGGLIVASAIGLSFVLPSLWSTIVGNITGRLAFGASATAQTIGEAQPPLAQESFAEFVRAQYGLVFVLAFVVIAYILVRPLVTSDETNHTLYAIAAFPIVGSVYVITPLYEFIGGLVGLTWQLVGLAIATALFVGATLLAKYDTEELYFIVWAGFITSMAFTQVRFNYYLAVIVAVGGAYFFQMSMSAIDLNRPLTDVETIKGWQAIAAVSVVVVIVAPLVMLTTPVWAAGAGGGPGPVTVWDDSLEWMSEETPEPGELEGNDNAMEYYGTYDRPAEGDFEYPEGAYGVQSWWDYGHWITVRGERIPNANPFQQNAGEAANYLLAPSEEQAAEVLERQSTEGGQTRYVMIDWQMLQGKFSAPVTFYGDSDVERDDFRWALYSESQEGRISFETRLETQRFYESQMVRLFRYYGSAVEPDAQPSVVTWDNVREVENRRTGERSEVRTFRQGSQPVENFDNVTAARAFVNESSNAQIVGPSERVEALEHYRLVYDTNFQGQSLVRTFERVPGASVEGSGAGAGQEVRATVELEKPSGETFQYTQYAQADENGEFELHLPYSTTGYDEFGPENGYTNTSVEATGPYQVTTGAQVSGDFNITRNTGELEVTEAQVVGADDAPATVELEETAVETGGGN